MRNLRTRCWAQLWLAILAAIFLAGCPDGGDDDDSSSYGESPSPTNDNDGDGHYAPADCNDEDVNIHPGAPETCNGVDDDCDDQIDEGVIRVWYIDVDGDGYGGVQELKQCDKPPGYVATPGDCLDTDASVYPAAQELCDAKDNDCDGAVDEDFDQDADGDGKLDCLDDDADGDGYAPSEGDCDDLDPDAHPGAVEVCDAKDNDCDGAVDEGFDLDVDGYKDSTSCSEGDLDCNDGDPAIYPGAVESCDGIDNNCDGQADEGVDQDGDGYVVDCDGVLETGEDCDDSRNYVYPGATERCNGIDDDCDGLIDDADIGVQGQYTWHLDDDGDGYGDPDAAVKACERPAGYVADNDDCDDVDPEIHPDAVEVCDGIDQDCDDVIDDVDLDEDGYLDESCVTAPDTADDCNDADEDIHPGATDPSGDGIDQDCDGNVNGFTAWSPPFALHGDPYDLRP